MPLQEDTNKIPEEFETDIDGDEPESRYRRRELRKKNREDRKKARDNDKATSEMKRANIKDKERNRSPDEKSELMELGGTVSSTYKSNA